MSLWLHIAPLLWAALVLTAAAARRPRPGATRRLAAIRETPAVSGLALAPVGVVVAMLLDLRLGVAAGIAVWIRGVMARRREAQASTRRIQGELPEVIDLLALSLAAGGSPALAVSSLASHRLGPVSVALGDAAARIDRGQRFVDAVEAALGPLGEAVAPLRRALVGTDHYGTEIGPTLERLAAEARDARRRRAQTDARRVPVRMLLPLVLTVLPAFVLLTVVPTLAGTFDGLEFTRP